MNSKLALTTILAVVFVGLVKVQCQITKKHDVICYDCQFCNDPFNMTRTNQIQFGCNGSCRKDKVCGFVYRSCDSEKHEEKCEPFKYHGQTGVSCYCNSDLCNGGSVERLSVMLSVTIFVVMILKALVW